MRIVFLGKKPLQVDKFFGTGIAWHGKGDVQTVPEEVGTKMLKTFPDVYGPVPEDSSLPGHNTGEKLALFGGGDPPPAAIDTILVPDPETGRDVALREAKFSALKRHLETVYGVQVRVGMSRTDLIQMVVDLVEAGKGPAEDPPPAEMPPAEDAAAGEEPEDGAPSAIPGFAGQGPEGEGTAPAFQG